MASASVSPMARGAPRGAGDTRCEPRQLRRVRKSPSAQCCVPPSSFERVTSSSAIAAVATATLLLSSSTPAYAYNLAATSEAFTKNCAGCHAAGGNVVAAGATLRAPDLAQNGVDTLDAVTRVVALGKGKMPGYGEACAPKGQCTFGPRLSSEDIASLASYVLDNAAAGWVDVR